MLDLSSFEKAIKQLEKSLGFYDAAFAKKDTDMVEQFRSASIQAFEYTYEMSWKTLKRYFEASDPSTNFDDFSFFDLIRTGNEKELLLGESSDWGDYRKARGATSHTYDEEKAKGVFGIIPKFLQEAKHLLATLQKKVKP
jgi:nucleotidyltransferase substrate binding protein (TIGR01987 family)